MFNIMKTFWKSPKEERHSIGAKIKQLKKNISINTAQANSLRIWFANVERKIKDDEAELNKLCLEYGISDLECIISPCST